MTDEITNAIEMCAQKADEAVRELDALLHSPASHKSKYDRRTAAKLRYALWWCKRIAAKIRASNDQHRALQNKSDPDTDIRRLQAAIAALLELRPLVNAARETSWKRRMLTTIDDVVKKPLS